MYKQGKRLKLSKLVAVTEKVHKLLRTEKKKQNLSMAKIVCNLVLEAYGKDKEKN